MSSSIEILQIRNLSTEKDLSNPEQVPWEVSFYSDQTFILELKAPELVPNQLALVQGTIRMGEKNYVLNAVCKVSSMGEELSGCRQTEFRLQQFNRNLWSDFLKFQKEAEVRTELIFQTIKGEG